MRNNNRTLLVLAAVEEVLSGLILPDPVLPSYRFHPDTELQTKEAEFVTRFNALVREQAEKYGVVV